MGAGLPPGQARAPGPHRQPASGGPPPRRVEREGVRIRQLPADRRILLCASCSAPSVEARRAVTAALARRAPDVLQLYQPFSGYGALRSDRARSLPCLYTFLSPAPLEYASREGMTGQHRLA